ncbi:MAG: hypothetical protein RR061_08460 [Muribaculaceae bacterium]
MKKNLLKISLSFIFLAILAIGITNIIENQANLNSTKDSTLLACNKCDLSDTNRKCGKCGGFLDSRTRQVNVKGKDGRTKVRYKTIYTCTKCKHECISWWDK